MFKKIITLGFVAINLFAIPFAHAEENFISQAVIKAETSVETDRNIIFDASNSYLPATEKEITYEWDFGDGNKDEGIEVVHTYKKPQLYNVLLKITFEGKSIETNHDVHVYRKLNLLITDNTKAAKRISGIKNYASDQQVFIKEIESFGSASEFISEEILAKRLSENTKFFEKTKQILIWTDGNAGLNALSRFLKETNQTLSDKVVIMITENLESTQTRIQKQFPLLQPKQIILIQESALYPYIDSTSEQEFINRLGQGGYQYKIVDSRTGKLKVWNFMSYFLNSLIGSGIPDNTVLLILLLPVIATVVALMRQVVGITTFGIYSPSIITLALLILGLKFGIFTFILILAMGAIVRHGLIHFRLLFVPKMAIVMTFVALTIFALLTLTIHLNWFDSEFITLAIFPILVMSTLSEKFINAQSERGFMSAVVLMGETIFVSIVAYFVAGGGIDLGFVNFKMEFIKNLMLGFPEFIIVIFIINIALGRWTGLRLLEYIRFREILRHTEE